MLYLIDFIKTNPSVLKRPIVLDEHHFLVGYNEEEIRVFIPRDQRKNNKKDKNSVYNINVICNSVEEKKKKKLLKLQASNFNIDLVDVSETELHQKFVKENFPVSISATFKFFLPELFQNCCQGLFVVVKR